MFCNVEQPTPNGKQPTRCNNCFVEGTLSSAPLEQRGMSRPLNPEPCIMRGMQLPSAMLSSPPLEQRGVSRPDELSLPDSQALAAAAWPLGAALAASESGGGCGTRGGTRTRRSGAAIAQATAYVGSLGTRRFVKYPAW